MIQHFQVLSLGFWFVNRTSLLSSILFVVFFRQLRVLRCAYNVSVFVVLLRINYDCAMNISFLHSISPMCTESKL